MKVANAFSVSMLPTERITTVSFAGPQTAAELKGYLARCAAGEPLESVIGHADTAKLVGSQLGVELPVNRVNVKLAVGEHLIVAQYVGPRLPEGTTELPEGTRIDYYVVIPLEVE